MALLRKGWQRTLALVVFLARAFIESLAKQSNRLLPLVGADALQEFTQRRLFVGFLSKGIGEQANAFRKCFGKIGHEFEISR